MFTHAAIRRVILVPICLAVSCLFLHQSFAKPVSPTTGRLPDEEDEVFVELGFNGPTTGVSNWRVSEPCLNLWILNQPLTYQTSLGSRLGFEVAFKQRDERTNNSRIFGLGPSWGSSWLSYVEYSVTNGIVTVGKTYVPLGGFRRYVADGITKEFKSASYMSKQTNAGGTLLGFQIDLRDGSRLVYGFLHNVSSNENYALLSQQIDPAGRSNTLNYDVVGNVVRLRSMVDFDGRTNTVRYDAVFSSQIGEIENHYGEKAVFAYDAGGRLASIRNVGGMTNSFAYSSEGVVTNMVTPYGATGFLTTTNSNSSTNSVLRSAQITETDGTKHLYVFRIRADIPTYAVPTAYPTNCLPSTSPITNAFSNTSLSTYVTFLWNPQQYAALGASFLASGNFENLTLADYNLANARVWYLQPNTDATPSLRLERMASPDASTNSAKIWFDSLGAHGYTCGTNVSPRCVASVLPDGTSQFSCTERNSWELPTRVVTSYTTDAGVSVRTNTIVYAANGIDAVEFRGPNNELISSNAYNGFHQVVTEFNAVGDRTDYTYDAAHRLTSVRRPTGLVTTNFYFTSGAHIGWLQSSIDYEGSLANALRTNSFSYTRGMPTSVTDARGLTTSSGYDSLLRITNQVTPAGTKIWQYDRLDLTNTLDELASSSVLCFDNMRRLCATWTGFGVGTNAYQTNSFFYTNGLLVSRSNPLLETTGYSFDFMGNVIATTLPDTNAIQQRYDLFGRLTNVIDAAGVSVTNCLNNQGLVYAVSNAVGPVLLRRFDNRDRVTNEVNASGITILSTYDNLNRVVSRSYPDGGMERFEYSPRGLVSYTNQLGKVTRYGYDALGRKVAETNANGEVTRYAYNGAGDLLSVTDGKNQSTQFGYDPFGRVTNQIDATGTTILRYTYDALGRVINRWSIGKGDTGYAYDTANNLTRITYPHDPQVNFVYNQANRLVWMTDSLGTTAFNYTSWGALMSEENSGNTEVAYTYGLNHLRSGMTIEQANGSLISQSYQYDAANRLRTLSSWAGTFTYSYQGAGSLLQKILYPNGAYVTNSYDNVGRMLSTQLKSSAQADLDRYTYLVNSGNQRTRQTRLDGSYVDYTYDDIGQLKKATGHESGGAVRLNENLGYGYDLAGNLNSRTNNALVQSFACDSRNQLASVTRAGTLTVSGATTVPASAVSVNGAAAARYGDNTFARENLALADGNNAFTVVAADSYGRGNTNSITANLPAAVNFTYDLNGNLASDGLRTFTYDDENRLVRVEVANAWRTENRYDGLGRKRMRDEYVWFNGAWVYNTYVQYLYDGNLVVDERWAGGEPPVHYTRGWDMSGTCCDAMGGIGGLLARSQNVSGMLDHEYYHADGNGNITTLINGSQQVTARYLYDPFGKVLAMTGPMAERNTYRFSSKEASDTSGLVDFGRRFYDPNLQRWLNRDPLGYAGVEVPTPTPGGQSSDPMGVSDWLTGASLLGADLRAYVGKDASGIARVLPATDMIRSWDKPRRSDLLSGEPVGIEGQINLYAYVKNVPINAYDAWGLAEQKNPQVAANLDKLTEQEILRILNQLRNQLNNKNPPGSEGEKAVLREIDKWLDRLKQIRQRPPPPPVRPPIPWWRQIGIPIPIFIPIWEVPGFWNQPVEG